MAQPKQILDRRETVRNISKITRTMEMISTGRFRQFQQRVLDVRAYTDAIMSMVHNVLRDARGESTATLQPLHPLLKINENCPRDAIVVLCSNRGLCGGYNQGILRMTLDCIAQSREEGREVDIYAIGRKAHIFFRLNNIPVTYSAQQYERTVEVDEVDALAAKLIDSYVSGYYNTVKIAHATFISASIQRPMTPTLLPLGEPQRMPSQPHRGRGRSHGSDRYDYLPEPGKILETLLPRTVSLKLMQAFLDAVLSEHVSRMTSMHLATENAGEMITDLTMQYNRARQGTITTELAEIVTGVEAMK